MSNSPLQDPPADYFPSGSDNWFLIPEGKDAGKQMFYYDYSTGPEQPEVTVVLVHGNPESSYTYRHIRDALIESGKPVRIIAMDHIGFGLSDQATFEMVEIHHSDNLLQLVRHLDLKDVTLAVHDWGGPIGIGTFIQEPLRVKNLLVMNTEIFPMPPDGYTYQNYPISWLPWCNVPKVIPDALWGGVAAYVVSHASPQGTLPFLANVSWYCLRHALHLFPKGTPEYVWSQMLRSRANTKSSKRNVLQTPHWGSGWTYDDPAHGAQNNTSYYHRMHRDVPTLWGPEGQNIKVCGFFGQWDACGKKSVIRQWQDALPQMIDNTFEFPGIGHFIEEHKGPEMAACILEMNGL